MQSYFQGNLIRGQAALPFGVQGGGLGGPVAARKLGCEGNSQTLGEASPFPASPGLGWLGFESCTRALPCL